MSIISNKQAWLPDLLYNEGQFLTSTAVTVDDEGRVSGLVAGDNASNAIQLKGKAMLPGLVNAHSHAFQRVIRGRTEFRSHHSSDSFWTWRELMYQAANKLGPDDIYAASRMAFLEMALSGITAVGEFHYLHRTTEGQSYDDPNLLAKEVVRAANDVGLRIALLRVAYERAGFQRDPNPLQNRFIEDANTYVINLDRLNNDLRSDRTRAWVGAAPHSVRAVSLNYLKVVNDFVTQQSLPIHMHVAEQLAEVSDCIEEYGRSPVALLDTEGLLNDRFTAVHAIHVTPKAIAAMARVGASVCACPTTERNLGDGVVPAEGYFANGVRICFGSDSQIQIDLLEDARELEYHLRLQRKERNVLAASDEGGQSAMASRLFECATVNGARSIGFSGGKLEPGSPADFFTVDLSDPSIAGASLEDLISTIVFSLSRTAIKDVVVGGKRIVTDGSHSKQDEVVNDFKAAQSRLWS